MAAFPRQPNTRKHGTELSTGSELRGQGPGAGKSRDPGNPRVHESKDAAGVAGHS